MRGRLLRGAVLFLLLAVAAPAAMAADAPASPAVAAQTALEAAPSARPLLSFGNVVKIKIGVAAAGALLLLLGMALRRAGRPHAGRRWRDGLLVGVAGLAALCWWDLLQFHHAQGSGFTDVQYHDTFHYYMGSKYFAELGYSELYHCTALAVARGRERLEMLQAPIRDLATNRLESAQQILAERERCIQRLSSERWREFQQDIGWFRGRMPSHQWEHLLLDHGYNPTPVWTLLGSTLANTGPASDLQIRLLLLLDLLLLATTWACVGWAFGWRVLCVALIFWGTNIPASYTWVGGSFLRQCWFAALVVGLCMMRREKNLAAGFLLGLATLLRVFPGVVFAAIGIQALLGMLSRRSLRLARPTRQLALGGLLSLLTLVPLASLSGAGPNAWLDFAEGTRVDWQPGANRMGLRTVLAYDPATRWEALLHELGQAQPEAEPAALRLQLEQLWFEARANTFESRRWLFYALALVMSGLLLASGRGQPAWVAAILGIGFLPVALEPTCYYFAFLVVYAFLSDDYPGIAVALCALSALGGLLLILRLPLEDLYPALSLLSLAFLVYASLALRPWRRAQVPPSGVAQTG